jgi:hypothetical protein
VLCIPDEYLAMNVAKQTKVKILTWKGHCEVHERFTAEELLAYKEADPEIEIIGHPECPPEVIAVVRLFRLDRGHDQLRQGHEAAEGAAGHRMLDGVQHPERGEGSSSSSRATCART